MVWARSGLSAFACYTPGMAINAKITPLDSETDLLIVGEKVAIRWAGCLYGPSDGLEAVANGDLLTLCSQALHSPETKWREIEMVDYDDGLGLVEVPPPEKLPARAVKTIAFTGGPGAGKSSLLPKLAKQLREDGHEVYVVPEAATILINGGYDASGLSTIQDHFAWQLEHVGLQKKLEDSFVNKAKDRAKDTGKHTIVLCDRGMLDGEAYYPSSLDTFFEDVLASHDLTREQVLARYDKVVHLETQAVHSVSAYAGRENPARWQSAHEAIESDFKLKQVWLDHKDHSVIPASAHIDQKYSAALAVVRECLSPPAPRSLVPIVEPRRVPATGEPDPADLVAPAPSSQVYAFWNGEDITTQVIASSADEALRKALDPINVTISTNRPFETPYEFKNKIHRAKIKVYPLNAPLSSPPKARSDIEMISSFIARPDKDAGHSIE